MAQTDCSYLPDLRRIVTTHTDEGMKHVSSMPSHVVVDLKDGRAGLAIVQEDRLIPANEVRQFSPQMRFTNVNQALPSVRSGSIWITGDSVPTNDTNARSV